jgi:hypothetical protein
LWSGGAWIMLALDRLLHGAGDHFFTLDASHRQRAQAARPAEWVTTAVHT